MREAENRLFGRTCLWWLVLFVFSMAGMLYLAQHKTLAAEREQSTAADAETDRAYRMCVVLDPLDPETVEEAGGAETDGDDVALAVAQRVAAALADSDIRVRLTRSGAMAPSAEERLALAEKSGADYYICMDVSSSPEPETYGISGYYNAEYFIPEFGNAELADLLVRSVTLAVSDRAVGLYAAEADSVLMELSVPSAQVNLGYITNETEYTLMRQDDYQAKLAQGIEDVLLELLEDETE